MSHPPVVVIQDGPRRLRFIHPVRQITARRPDEVIPALQAVEAAVNQEGLYAAGFLTYEAAAAYGLAVNAIGPDDLPLLWFGLFAGRESIELSPDSGGYEFGDWKPSSTAAVVTAADYAPAVGRIKEAIAAGYTYQVNLTFRLQAPFDGDTWALYCDLSRAQRAAFTAYLDLGRYAVCSASPELFFRLDGRQIVSRPMKGTAPRGRMLADDRQQMEWLRRSEKNRAENVMIVDMIRNDIGRVADVGSVEVPELFTVERYPTLLQMTSTVTGRTSASLSDILAVMFPCASITGAPKISTMQIIRDLEPGPRGLYTGAIGYLAPNRQAQFNVAIRTVVIDRDQGLAAYGVGSGIVWDSDAAAEYEECRLKAQVLTTGLRQAEEFCLMESLRWTPEDGYWLLERHLQRLADSAEYLGFSLNRAGVESSLLEHAAGLTKPSKVRLLADQNGRIRVVSEGLGSEEGLQPVRVGLAASPVSSSDNRLYHKTTRREVYENARASRPDCDEVILWNERGEITEAGAFNVVVVLGGRRLTPPVTCGLLPGVFRAELLARGEIEEAVLRPDDLRRAESLMLINSVRGRRPAVFVDA